MGERGAKFRLHVIAPAMALGALALVSFGVLHACTVANDLALPERDAEVPVADAGDGCEHVLVPQAPIDPDGVGQTITLAFKRLSFEGKDGGAGTLGFDLDGKCTCRGEPIQPRTCIPRLANPEPTTHCDGPGGRDNAVASVTQTVTGAANLQDFMNKQLDQGTAGILIRVDGYNGGPNDAHVSVHMYPSKGTYVLADAGPGVDAEAIHVDPAEAGARWSYDPAYADERLVSRILSTDAYVRDGVLVTPLAGGLPLAGLELVFTSGYLVGKLEPNPWRIEAGVIAGRWKMESLYNSVGKFTVSFGGSSVPVCALPTFSTFAAELCKKADIAALPSDDGKPLPCDALSVAIGFVGEPAIIGDPVPIASLPGCGGDDAGNPEPLVCP